MNPTNTATAFQPAIISDTSEERILEALEALYNITYTYKTDKEGPGAEVLPSFATCKGDESFRRRITGRAHAALAVLEAHRKEQKVAAFRQGAREVILPYIETHRADMAEYASLSSSMKAKMGPFPTAVTIPVSDFAHIFATGTTVGSMVGTLKDLGYTLSKGKGDTFNVRVEVPVKVAA